MRQDVIELVHACAHCVVSKAPLHQSAPILQTINCNKPFAIVFLDYWSPGDSVPSPTREKTVLTCLYCVTSFLLAYLLKGLIDAKVTAFTAFASFFSVVGLP